MRPTVKDQQTVPCHVMRPIVTDQQAVPCHRLVLAQMHHATLGLLPKVTTEKVDERHCDQHRDGYKVVCDPVTMGQIRANPHGSADQLLPETVKTSGEDSQKVWVTDCTESQVDSQMVDQCHPQIVQKGQMESDIVGQRLTDSQRAAKCHPQSVGESPSESHKVEESLFYSRTVGQCLTDSQMTMEYHSQKVCGMDSHKKGDGQMDAQKIGKDHGKPHTTVHHHPQKHHSHKAGKDPVDSYMRIHCESQTDGKGQLTSQITVHYYPQKVVKENATEIDIGPHTATQSGVGPHTATQSGVGPHTATQSGVGPHTTRQSDIGPHTTRQSDIRPHTATQSDVGPQTASQSGVGPHTTRQSDIGPHTTRQSDIRPQTARQSDVGRHTTRQSDVGPHTARQSDIRPHTARQSDVGPHTTRQSDVGSHTTSESGIGPQKDIRDQSLTTNMGNIQRKRCNCSKCNKSDGETAEKRRKQMTEEEMKGKKTRKTVECEITQPFFIANLFQNVDRFVVITCCYCLHYVLFMFGIKAWHCCGRDEHASYNTIKADTSMTGCVTQAAVHNHVKDGIRWVGGWTANN